MTGFERTEAILGMIDFTQLVVWGVCKCSSSAIEVPIMSLAFPNGDIFEISYGLLGVYDSTVSPSNS